MLEVVVGHAWRTPDEPLELRCHFARRDLRDGDKVRFGGYTTIVKIVSRL